MMRTASRTKRVVRGKGNEMIRPTYINEAKARQAGMIAAIDAICEYADRFEARHFANLCSRADRLQPTRRTAKAAH